jgi:hypothetical protein
MSVLYQQGLDAINTYGGVVAFAGPPFRVNAGGLNIAPIRSFPRIALRRLNVPSNRPGNPRLSSAGKKQKSSKTAIKVSKLA